MLPISLRRSDPRRGVYWASSLRSVALYAVTMAAVVVLVFVVPRAMPGDPLAALDDPGAGQYLSDPVVRERVMAHYGFDKPLPQQFGRFVAGVTRGDLGYSIGHKAPVATLIRAHLPWTLLLMGVSLAASSAVSFVAGVTAGWRRGDRVDGLLVTGMTAARAVPEYAIAALLLLAFAGLVPLFPIAGARTQFADHGTFRGALDVAYHLALPATALTLSLLGSKFLLVRNTVISSLGEDYMVLARAKGLPERRLKFRHAGRNALLPFLTLVGAHIAFAVGGSLFVETVFTYPGMGTLVFRAVGDSDYPLLEGTFLVLALVVLAVNLLLELLYVRVDPRIGRK